MPCRTESAELCLPVDDADFERFVDEVNGLPRAATWRPISVAIVRKDEGVRLHGSDSPWLGEHALILRERAVEAMGPLLESCGELLPLRCADARSVDFNRWLLDALDEDASTVDRLPSSGRIMWIRRHVFRPGFVTGIDAFKIPNLRSSATYVSERFVERWTAAGLVGLTFEEIWRSD